MTNNFEEAMIDDEETWHMLSLRQYQLELVQTSKKHNSIIFLPTGSGKTYIALQVLRSKMKDLKLSTNQRRKIAVFLATTKVLVNQLYDVIQENTSLKVKPFFGEMGVDDWTVQEWCKETDGVQVLVMVPAILLIILQKHILRSDEICLIVFDECHHAVFNHPYRQIMQEFETLPKVKQPLVLGLTSTVLNANPKNCGDEVSALKNTLKSDFAKTERLEEAVRFSTSAKTHLISYQSSETSNVENILRDMINNVCECMASVKVMGPLEKMALGVMPEGNILLAKKNVVVKEIQRIFKSLERAIEDLGLYPTTIVILYYYIRLERLRLIKENPAAITVIKYALTVLNLLRRTIFKYVPMQKENNVRTFSSKKVTTLIDYIDNYKGTDDLKCIIMVDEKITAIVLAAILNELSQNGNSFYKADFVTGGLFSSVFDQEETNFEQKRLRRVVESFKNNEFHFLIATNVVEEGLDVSSCNLVIKYDYPKDYRSYIQSKGRARFKDSDYVIFCPEKERRNVSDIVTKFNNTYENLMKTLLTVEGVIPEAGKDKEEEDGADEEVFFVKGPNGPHITGSRAVSFVMRYCSRLPQDKFSFLAPICWYDPEKKKAFLRLPSSSPVRKTIEGDVRKNQKLAKKNVFLKTVEELYKAGEILEDLTLRSYKCKTEDHKHLFREYIAVSSNKQDTSETSDKRKKYKMAYPKNLSDCMPQPFSKSYLHVIKITPQFPRPEDSRTGMFYDLLCDSNGFAILSSKQLSEICQFPLFLRMGDFMCSIEVNAAEVLLSNSQLENLKKFHFFIFNTLLEVVNRLHVLNSTGEGYSFLVIPVQCVENKPIINWDVVYDLTSRTQNADLKEMETENPTIEDYTKSVVYTKYGQMSYTKKYYIVTSVDRSQNPMSPFPSPDFKNYYEYFLNKYSLKIKDKEQPLIEVKSVPERINFIKPRWKHSKTNRKNKFEEGNDNFREHLVPELCIKISFPALFWLKATLLPSALYRIMTISLVDDARKTIASATQIGISDLGSKFSWLPLDVNKDMIEEDPSPPLDWILNTKLRGIKSQDENPELQSPVDLFRHMDECAPCDLIHYVKYFGLVPSEENPTLLTQTEKEVTENVATAGELKMNIPDLPFSFDNGNGKGPELRDFVKVFTCKSANDIVDLEILEFLGDSFLKFSAVLYVFRNYDENEGALVSIKDKIISNQNLYSCGITKGFAGIIIANEFDPKSGWSAPYFDLPQEIKSVINNDERSFCMDYSFEIPVEDKLSGKLNPKTAKVIQGFVNSKDKRFSYTLDEIVLHRKSVPEKSIADCVEALLGLYVKECGLVDGFKILNWLNILPEPEGTYNELMAKKYLNPNPTDAEKVMESLNEIYYEEIEQILGYEFHDKALLLEALTHPSVIDSTIPSYQRLELLGDAVIDFIVTLYIHHSCSELPPGDTTDIRMSLVNNVTMACIAVKYNFHKYLIHRSPPLLGAIGKFVTFQKKKNHKVEYAINILAEEGEYKVSEAVEVPKALGDLFESLAGAIFLDSGNCLKTVWRSYYSLMKDTIEMFIRDPPKSPIRKLYEYCKPPPVFRFQRLDNGFVRAICEIIHCDKEHKFIGKASSCHYSKMSAAKHAVAFLEGSIEDT